MAGTTLDTIDELLAGAMDDVDDSEVAYGIRSARQLLAVVRKRHDDLDEAIEEAVDDRELTGTLRDLGYLE